MSGLFNQASLVLVPSGYKAGKVYSEVPTNGDGDLTFTRASDATRVNSDGLIESPRTNLVTYSEQFDDASWNKVGIGTGSIPVVTANHATAPNGTTTAERFECNLNGGTTSSDRSWIDRSFVGLPTSGDTTISIYIKSNTLANFNIVFQLTGTTNTDAILITAGQEWVRYDISRTRNNSISLFRIGLIGNVSGVSNTCDILIWGAQLEINSTATEYIPTTNSARTTFAGITQDGTSASNIPRLDYSQGSCPTLLLEPQRTNLVLYSEEFDNAAWGKSGATITANTTTSPDGNTNADRIFETTNTGNHGISQSIFLSLGTNYAVSCYVKKGNRSYCGLQFWYNATNGVIAFYNLDNGTLVYEFAEGSGYSITNSKIQDVGNGWYRLSAVVQVGITFSFPGIVMASTEWSTGTSYDNSYLGDSSKYMDVYGFQLEEGAYATSYIKTTSATVTRLADTFSRNNIYTNGLITSSGGTWYVELKNNVVYTDGIAQAQLLGLGNNVVGASADNLWIASSNNFRIRIWKQVAGTLTGLYTTSTDTLKTAIKWNGTTADVFVNGTKVVSATSFTPTALESLRTYAVQHPYYIQQMALYPTPLEDVDCEVLTGEIYTSYSEMATALGYTII